MPYLPYLDCDGQPYGCCELFQFTAADVAAHWRVGADDDGTPLYAIPYEGVSADDGVTDPAELAGWYWQASFPGCLPDGDPSGPFASFTLAADDAECLNVRTLPTHWASALINDDLTGFDDAELAQFNAVCDGENLSHCEGIVGDDAPDGAESSFMRFHDAQPYGVLACDCYRYIFS